MANLTLIFGVQRILSNLAVRNAKIAAGCEIGLKMAGLRLQRESQRVVPVDFGPLKASAYTRQKGTGVMTVVEVGYTAAYALEVHENVAMRGRGHPRQAPSKGNYWDPKGRGQAKFLEEPLRRLQPVLSKLIRDKMKI